MQERSGEDGRTGESESLAWVQVAQSYTRTIICTPISIGRTTPAA